MATRSEKYRSRLDHDPTTMGLSVLIASAVSLLVTFILFPPNQRNEDLEESMKRFGYEGPTRYEREIEVRLSDQAPLLMGQNRLLGGIRRSPDSKSEGTPLA